VVVLDIPSPPVDVRNLQIINRAIRHQKSLKITHRSMSGKPETTYTVSPHTLVHNGFRWHVRGFSAEHGEFRDFVLSRITAVPAESSMEYTPDDGDQDWHNILRVKLIPHPGLNDRQREIIETDYGMTGGVLRIEQRAALLPYLLRLMRIPTVEAQDNPRAHPVVIENRQALQAFMDFA
jgi:predicted DNA-binding transcriptional regulator YafY